jgi:hypothetical protein
MVTVMTVSCIHLLCRRSWNCHVARSSAALSGQAVQSVREASPGRPSQYNSQLGWAGCRVRPALYSLRRHWCHRRCTFFYIQLSCVQENLGTKNAASNPTTTSLHTMFVPYSYIQYRVLGFLKRFTEWTETVF